jgi:hypothetical protein
VDVAWSPGVAAPAVLDAGGVVGGGVVGGGVVGGGDVGGTGVVGEVAGTVGAAECVAQVVVAWFAIIVDAARDAPLLGVGLPDAAQDEVDFALGDGPGELVPTPCPGEFIRLCAPLPVSVPPWVPCVCPVDMTDEPSWTIACRTGGTVMARVAAKATLAAASAGRIQPM